jgi:hypothetical protein
VDNVAVPLRATLVAALEVASAIRGCVFFRCSLRTRPLVIYRLYRGGDSVPHLVLGGQCRCSSSGFFVAALEVASAISGATWFAFSLS